MTSPTDGNSRDDEHVAASRAGKSDDRDGTYVGQTSPDDALDVGETGAEARSRERPS